MSNSLKIRKPKNRWHKPSDKFLEAKERKALSEEKLLIVGIDLAEGEGESTPTTSDDIKIFLDDERPCPEGWTLVRTPREFFDLLGQGDDFLTKVTNISLDWYLGHNQISGIEVSMKLAYKFTEAFWEDEPTFFLPNLRQIGFHSSDIDQARRMRTILAEALSEQETTRPNRIRYWLGQPRG